MDSPPINTKYRPADTGAMPAETGKDPRLLCAKLAIAKLRDSLFSRCTIRPAMNKDDTNTMLGKLDSTLMALMFSYLPPREMATSQMSRDIFEMSKELYMGYEAAMDGFDPLPRANILWAFGVLSGLQRRLRTGDAENPTAGIDIVAVTIRNISRSGDLHVTSCIAGPRQLTIVTNIPGLKAGDTLAAAFLPPVIVGGKVSEAMFLGADRIKAAAGSFLNPDVLNTKEADGILYNEVRKL